MAYDGLPASIERFGLLKVACCSVTLKYSARPFWANFDCETSAFYPWFAFVLGFIPISERHCLKSRAESAMKNWASTLSSVRTYGLGTYVSAEYSPKLTKFGEGTKHRIEWEGGMRAYQRLTNGSFEASEWLLNRVGEVISARILTSLTVMRAEGRLLVCRAKATWLGN